MNFGTIAKVLQPVYRIADCLRVEAATAHRDLLCQLPHKPAHLARIAEVLEPVHSVADLLRLESCLAMVALQGRGEVVDDAAVEHGTEPGGTVQDRGHVDAVERVIHITKPLDVRDKCSTLPGLCGL